MDIDLNTTGSIASILSLFFTGWVVYAVRSLQQFYNRHLLLPQFISELSGHIKNTKKALEDKRSDDAKATLQKCDALIERMPKYGDKALKKRIKLARKSIKVLMKDTTHNFLSHAKDVISEIDAVVESANAFTGEDKWKK